MTYRTFAVAASLILGTVAVDAAAPPDLEPPHPGRTKHHLLEAAAKTANSHKARLLDSWAPVQGPSPIDVRHYALDLVVEPGRQRLSGTATLDIAALVDGLATIDIDADLGLRILSVALLSDSRWPDDSPRALEFSHRDDRLTIALPDALEVGDAVRLRISYGGRASRDGYGVNWASHGGAPVAFTFAEPFGARVWFPCNDRPDDKATFEMTITAPADLRVAANGLERSRVDHGDGAATTVWSTAYPTSTYLAVLNLSDFQLTEIQYHALDGSTMPIQTWAYPELSAAATDDLAITADMIEALVPYYGEYPFVTEKYGNLTAPFGGGMEHQTLTTIAASAIGDSWMDWLNVHELGHQWWGDMVTCDDWRELWLNEGMATHTEWLWAEHLGSATLTQVLSDSDGTGWFRGAVYDNPVAFSSTVYDKGAWVLRMLRKVVGDDDFFDGLALYRERRLEGSATSEDLRSAMEDVSGEELEWFFDEWVYGANRPRLQWSWDWTGAAVQLDLEQEQTNAGLFRMPLDVELTSADGTVVTTVWFEAESLQTIEIPSTAAVTGVRIDPDHWLLAEISRTTDPDLDLGPDFPGPYDAGVVVGTQGGQIIIPMTNTGGSALQVTRILTLDAGSFEIVSPATPLSIAPGESRDIVVAVHPSGPRLASDYVYVESNDPSHGGATYIPVRGTGALSQGPRAATQTSVTFSSTPAGGSSERSFQVTNLGSQDLTLATTLDGDAFRLSSLVPATVGPSQTTRVYVRFAPTAAGEYSGMLRIGTNDPVHPTLEVSLAGTATAAGRLDVHPELMVFDDLAAASRTLRVCNQGDAVLSVERVDVPNGLEVDPTFVQVFPAELEPGACAQLGLHVTDDAPASGLVGDIRITSDDPSLPVATVPVFRRSSAAGPFDELAIPAAAASPGAEGSSWSTRAAIVNPGLEDALVDLDFRSSGVVPGDGPDLTLLVPAGGQRILDNLVTQASSSRAGGVRLLASAPVLVSSRTFSTQGDGTFGQLIPGFASRDWLGSGDEAWLAGLTESPTYRTNLGVFNLSDHTIVVSFDVYAADGGYLGTRELAVAAYGYAQRNRALAGLVAGEANAVSARVSTTDNDAAFLAWASIVDNRSNDPVFLPAVPSRSLTSSEQVIGIVAASDGLNGTHWTTDLVLFNPGPGTTTVSVAAGQSEPPGTEEFLVAELGPFETAVWSDVLTALHREGSNWLVIDTSDDPVLAWARIANDDPRGTYSQRVAAVATSDAATTGQTLILPGLRSDAGFRTNLGLTNLGDQLITVHAEVFGDSGQLLSTWYLAVPSHGILQIVRFLDGLVGYTGSGWARLSSIDPTASYLAHASVVGGDTGDAMYIPATTWVDAEGILDGQEVP
jgi:hypothetical protein